MSVYYDKDHPTRVAHPIQPWPPRQKGVWSDGDSFPVDEWFDAGEGLAFCESELLIDEPDRWERAFQWVRSLAIATKLIPA